MQDKKNIGKVLKILTYSAVIYLMFILQNTPYFLEICGVKPNLLYIAAVAISMYEGEFSGGIYGFFIGILCDYASYHGFGFNTILLIICCTAMGLAVIYYMKNSLLNAHIFAALLLGLRGFLEYYFVYAIWDYTDNALMMWKHIIPGIIYSLLFTFPIFWLFGKINRYYKHKYDPE